MDSPILKQIAKFLQDRKKHKHWTVIFTCMAILVCLGTVTALKLMGQAMTRKEKVLNCSLEVHQHTEECQDEAGNLICGLADYVVHVHNDDCYDSDGNLACTLPEIPAHVHTDECYADEEVLICGFEEEEGHVHDEACYEQQVTGLACTAPEHQHGTGCYDENNNLICTATEHQHTGECYDAQGNLICGQAAHTHMGSCYDKDNNLVCTIAEHQHAAECLTVEDVLVCEEEEGAGGHVHTDECYETQKVLACGQLELHTHSIEGGCFEEVPPAEEGGEPTYNLICTTPVLEEHVHSEEAGCFVIVEAAVADAAESVNGTEVAQSTEAAVPAEAVSSTETPVPTEAVNSTEVIAENTTETKEETEEFFKACESDGFIVSVTYGADAEIPEESELVAEMITPESDAEHYAEREEQYKQQVDDDEATMNALLKIGFYLDGNEIEPKAPVQVSVQLLDENGLPEGMPMTIVHFADEGSKVIKGSNVQNGKTSFETDGFSEYAFGLKKNARAGIPVSKECTYTDDTFKVLFRVEGVAKLPEGMTLDTPDDDEDDLSSEMESEGDVTSEGTPSDGDKSSGDSTEQKDSEEDAGDGGTENGDFSGEVSGGTNTAGDSSQQKTTEDVVAVEQGLEFKVEALDESSEEYEAFVNYTKDLDDIGEFILLRAMSYSVTYNDKELDLSDCEVTAEITPKKKLNNLAKKAIAAASKEVSEDDISEESLNIELTALSLLPDSDADVSGTLQTEVAGTKLLDPECGNEKFLVKLASEANAAGVYGVTTANPHFKVQYYSELEELAEGTSGAAGSLSVIDTSKAANGGDKAVLPKNGETPKTKTIKLDADPDKLEQYTQRTGIKTNKVMKEIYSQKNYEYIMAPSLNYFNVLIDNDGYRLDEIWVQPRGENPTSTERSDWVVYEEPSEVHFANREVNGYVEITDTTVIRLVYEAKLEPTNEFNSTFYDYNISSETIQGTPENGFTMRVYNAGINTATGKEGAQYAFGNGTMSWLASQTWGDNNTLNQANAKHPKGTATDGCTFGLVEGVDIANQTVKFSNGITANEIFGTSDSIGKKVYSDGQLNFRRTGDSYTLTTATLNGTSVNDLDKFWRRERWAPQGKPKPIMWANSFWPLDVVENATDPKFGKDNTKQKFSITPQYNDKNVGDVYESDENRTDENGKKISTDHNCFFGMYYEVEFDLDPAYVGPLDYLFFGDDDMWAFLDGDSSDKPAKLVCDIGGVHSAVGEYVDLWDYLHKHTAECYAEDGTLTCTQGSHEHGDNCYGRTPDGKIDKDNLICTHNKHKLRFFYTERGAAGSTCWMHFTLPSVSTITPQDQKNYGNLEVEKEVDLSKPVSTDVFDPDKEIFSFQITLNVVDDYRYTKYDKNHNAIENDLVLHNGSAFHLRDGEYIRIEYLPVGITYTITEENEAHEVMRRKVTVNNKETEVMIPNPDKPSDNMYTTDIQVNGTTQSGKVDLENDKTIAGNIRDDKIDRIKYINRFKVFELPETGGLGKTPYTIAGIITMFGAGFLYRKKFRERRV